MMTSKLARRRLLMSYSTDERSTDELVRSFNGRIQRISAGCASGTHALQAKKPGAMRMGFYKGTRYGG